MAPLRGIPRAPQTAPQNREDEHAPRRRPVADVPLGRATLRFDGRARPPGAPPWRITRARGPSASPCVNTSFDLERGAADNLIVDLDIDAIGAGPKRGCAEIIFVLAADDFEIR